MPKKASKPHKSGMKCGEIRKSTDPKKKVEQLVCKGDSKKIVRAGDSKYKHNYSDEARDNFKARHNCDEAKPGTAKHLACNQLWKKGGSVKTTGKGKRK